MSFLVAELIRKKRDGQELSAEEIAFLVEGFSYSRIPDYQISAWLMASFLRGLSVEETFTLTREMKDSGKTLNWRKLSSELKFAHYADKHSTGGVGDKVSLILAPIAACLGLKVPMMSGRGLGHTGGTVDKLEAIAGFNMYPSEALMVRCLEEVGVCMMAQAKDLCPADRKLYALRDVTGTVESVPLITASILSKKWAEGIDAIVFDVKTGDGAFMRERADAQRLARSLAQTAARAGLKAVSLITRMEEPLGAAIGNAAEVVESLQILRNQYPSAEVARLCAPLKNLSCDLAAEMAVLAGARENLAEAQIEAQEILESGRALRVFLAMVEMQGGEAGWDTMLGRAPVRLPVKAPRAGRVTRVRSRAFGVAGLKISMGRRRVEDVIDPSVTFELTVRPGDSVQAGQPLAWAFVQDAAQFAEIEKELSEAFSIEETAAAFTEDLILERIVP